MSTLVISNLVKHFDKTEALKGISFKVQKGEIFGFLGPNGAGKSTTLRCIMDYIRPTSGDINVFGKDSTTSATELKERISYVPAEPNLYPNWTVDEHISFVASLQKVDQSEVLELKKRLQLNGEKKVHQLSTGNQQKLSLILALATKPDLMLLDEPTRGLDPLLRSTLHTILKDYQKSGGTIILSSHDLSEVEELCTDLAIIKDGLLVTDDSLEKLKHSRTHKVKVSVTGKLPNLEKLETGNLVVTGKTLNFTLKGSLDPLLEELSKHKIKDLEVASASLEDIFMEIYS